MSYPDHSPLIIPQLTISTVRELEDATQKLATLLNTPNQYIGRELQLWHRAKNAWDAQLALLGPILPDTRTVRRYQEARSHIIRHIIQIQKRLATAKHCMAQLVIALCRMTRDSFQQMDMTDANETGKVRHLLWVVRHLEFNALRDIQHYEIGFAEYCYTDSKGEQVCLRADPFLPLPRLRTEEHRRPLDAPRGPPMFVGRSPPVVQPLLFFTGPPFSRAPRPPTVTGRRPGTPEACMQGPDTRNNSDAARSESISGALRNTSPFIRPPPEI